MKLRKQHRKHWMHYKMKEQIRFKIGKAEKNIQEKWVEIPNGTEQIQMTLEVPEEFQYMTFLFLEDPKQKIRFQKLLGYGQQNPGIGKAAQDTTIGGVPGEIHPGIWKIGMGIFTEYVAQKLGNRTGEIVMTISDQKENLSDPIGGDCWVENELSISEKRYQWEKSFQTESKWYSGDFHTHTRLSDGKETIEHASKRAEERGLDFYVPTEHNLMHTGWCKTSLCVLPGIEITTDNGHMNLFGITEMPERILEIVKHNGEDVINTYMEQTIEEAKKKGWLRSINHPFLTIWKWRFENTDLRDIDCMEIINDPTYPDGPESNDKAIRFLDEVWNTGIRLFGVGGSDSHNLEEELYEGATLPSAVGDPTTWVFCEGLSPRNLMQSVEQGHMCVTRFCRIEPRIEVDGKRYLPGDKLPNQKCEILYQADVSGLIEEPEIFLVMNGNYVALPVERLEDGTYQVKAHLILEEATWQWIRLEVRTKEQEFLGFVNPVSRGRKEPEQTTFGEIVKKLEG